MTGRRRLFPALIPAPARRGALAASLLTSTLLTSTLLLAALLLAALLLAALGGAPAQAQAVRGVAAPGETANDARDGETLADVTLCGLPQSPGAAALPTALGPGRAPLPPSASRYHPEAADPAAPWMAKLEVVEAKPGGDPAIWTCGAVVIAPDWLATAAHCVSIDKPLAYRVTVGARNLLDPKALRREGAAAYCHPGFDKDSLREDLALLRLSAPLPSDVPALRLATPDEVYGLRSGTTAISAGWARGDDGRVSPWLRRAEIRIVNPFRIEDGFIEAAPPLNGPSLCLGESGAPLIADLGQGPALHGVFTSVDVVWDQLSRRMTELCEGFEARSYFTPVRGRRLWMARVVSACGRNPLGCVASQ